MSSAHPAEPPAPPGGSVRYFVLLYTPIPHRRGLATLWALTDELAAGFARELDHEVAHVRLEWWRQEAERSARAMPLHPWLRSLTPSERSRLGLATLVQAAGIDLATGHLTGRVSRELPAAQFLQAAELLAPRSLAVAERAGLESLARWVGALEHPTDNPPSTAADSLAPPAALASPPIEPALQPALSPLLVWTALVLRRAQRHVRRAPARQAGKSGTMSDSRLDELVDNFIAWRAARRAARGRFRIPST